MPAEVAAAAQRAVAARQTLTLKFFTVAQHRTVDALTEVIIPTDERSPGARAAKVADYLDLVLNESPAEARQAWNDGIAALDAASRPQFTKPFADLTGEQQVAIVTEAARNEGKPGDAARDVLRRGQGPDHPRLLHQRDWHPPGAQGQGQPVPAGIRRVHSPRTYVLTGLGQVGSDQVGSGFTFAFAPSCHRDCVQGWKS